MRLDELLDVARLRELVAEGLVAEFRHPTEPLRLLDYTQRAQGRRAWEPTTELCRGLIVADDGAVVARPFRRMPSVDELASPPVGPFDATEKLDGSLVIHYREGRFATRRSFVSSQARLAEELWAERYSAVEVPFGQTWLFELMHPANRNIIDYADRHDLVLVGVVNIETGCDIEDVSWPGPMPRKWPGLPSVEALPEAEGEGFVLRLKDGRRLKCKADWYRRVETTMNRTTELTIWDALREAGGLEEIVAFAPPAFIEWAEGVAEDLLASFDAIERDSRKAAESGTSGDAQHPEVAYKIASSQPYADRIWRLIRPKSPERFRPHSDPAPGLGLEPRT